MNQFKERVCIIEKVTLSLYTSDVIEVHELRE